MMIGREREVCFGLDLKIRCSGSSMRWDLLRLGGTKFFKFFSLFWGGGGGDWISD